MRNIFGKWISDCADRDDKLILLSGDIGYGLFDDFINKYPNRFINTGIAEQNMVGVAAGLAASGYRPIVYTIIPFLIYRPYEFIRNLICSQKLPVIMVGVGGGFSYDNLGYTHYALEDLSLAKSLPNLEIQIPYDRPSTLKCLNIAYEINKPTYIRLMKGGEVDIEIKNGYSYYDNVIEYGNDFLFLTHGSICVEAIKACEILNNDYGIKCTIKVIRTPNSLEVGIIENFSKVILLEEHISPGALFPVYQLANNSCVDIYPMYVSNSNDFLFANRDLIFKNQQLCSDSIVKNILSLNYK